MNQSCKNIIENIKVFEVITSFFLILDAYLAILYNFRFVLIKCDGQNYLDKLQELNVHSIVVLNIPR